MKNYIKASIAVFAFALIWAYGASLTIAEQENAKNNKVPGQYIIVLNDDVEDVDGVVEGLEKAHGLGHLHTYKHALKGFAATVPEGKLDKIKSDPRVKFVSEDREVHAYDLSESKNPGGNAGKPGPTQPAEITPTGVKRIDTANAPNKGAGIVVAVMDSGIDTSHPDLAGQVEGGINCSTGKNFKDGNGHGTHVAGTIAALDNEIGVVGVAPESKLLAVRVLDNAGNGTWSSIICGINWVTNYAGEKNVQVVANMSLGGGGSSDGNCGKDNNDALHKAICASRDAGVIYVVAAGNEGDDAGNHVPSAYDDAVITVSALADSDGLPGGVGGLLSGWNYPDDTFAKFSNYSSSVVDLGAPGVNIRSTWKGGTYNTISGTSMASPHVAGAAALYLAAYPGLSWTEVRDGLRSAGEASGSGHTDPSGVHPEPVVKVSGL